MLSGIRYFFCGIKLILRPGIKRFVIMPLLMNISVFILGFWLAMRWLDQFLDRMLPDWLAWAEYILWPLFTLSYFLIVFYLFALLANLIAAPFNGFLAEKVETHLRAKTPAEDQFSFKALLKDILPSLASEVHKLFYFALRSLPILLLFLIPGINLLAPLLWFLFMAWILSLEYLDYPCANHNILFKQTRALAKQQRTRCLGFGATVSFLTMIPFVNFFVMPIAVAGATAMYVDTFSNK